LTSAHSNTPFQQQISEAGDYQLEVMDSNNCPAIVPFTVQPPLPTTESSQLASSSVTTQEEESTYESEGSSYEGTTDVDSGGRSSESSSGSSSSLGIVLSAFIGVLLAVVCLTSLAVAYCVVQRRRRKEEVIELSLIEAKQPVGQTPPDESTDYIALPNVTRTTFDIFSLVFFLSFFFFSDRSVKLRDFRE
jgi:hypothetical protein